MNLGEFGPYVLLRKLSKSALVETYSAGERDGQEVQPVVLLCLFNVDSEDTTWLAETAQAGRRALKGLTSNSLGSAVDSGEIEGTTYIAYDYISGGSLRTLMDRSRTQGAPVSLGHALLITNRIAQALLAAWQHESRALHGFVVPQLVMLSTEGDVQLLGLEVASRLRRLLTNEIVKREMGGYLAPEVVPEGQPSTTDDVFSLGALLFELATGRMLPVAPPGGYEAIIGDARLARGGPLPEPVTALLVSSLAPGPQRNNLKSWQAEIEREVVSGSYEASAFDLALYLHAIFVDELQAQDPPPEPADSLELLEPTLAEPEVLEPAPVEAEAVIEQAELEASLFEVPADTEPDVEPADAIPEPWEVEPTDSRASRPLAAVAAIVVLALVSFLAYKLFPFSPQENIALADFERAPAQSLRTDTDPGAKSPSADRMTDFEPAAPGASTLAPEPTPDRPVERTTIPPATTVSSAAQPVASEPQPTALDPREDSSNRNPAAGQQVALEESSLPDTAAAIEPDQPSEPSSSPSPVTVDTEPPESEDLETTAAAEIENPLIELVTPFGTNGSDPSLDREPASEPLDIESIRPFPTVELESDGGPSPVGDATASTFEPQDSSTEESPPPTSTPATSTPVTSTQAERLSAPAPVEPTVEKGDLVGPGPDVTGPRMTDSVAPVYPMIARRLKKTASVSIRALIDENGKVLEVERLGREAGYGFDEAALQATRMTVWQPATKNGVPVKMWWTVRIDFKP